MEIFKLALTIFKKRNVISKLLENITSTDDEDEINQNWASIFSVSKEICNIELCGETIAEHKNLVKMTACLGKLFSKLPKFLSYLLGDILQACVLFMLLLRMDLRVQGILSLAKTARNMGTSPGNKTFSNNLVTSRG